MVNHKRTGCHPHIWCYSIYLRRHLEWPVRHCKVCIQVVQCSCSSRCIGAVKVKFPPRGICVAIVFVNSKLRCRRLGDGVAVPGNKVTSQVSILRSWLTRNASGISFIPKLWYFLFKNLFVCSWFTAICICKSYGRFHIVLVSFLVFSFWLPFLEVKLPKHKQTHILIICMLLRCLFWTRQHYI